MNTKELIIELPHEVYQAVEEFVYGTNYPIPNFAVQLISEAIEQRKIDKNNDLRRRMPVITQNDMNDDLLLMNVNQACVFLGCSLPTLYRKLRTGEIPAAKIGRAWRIDRADLEAYINSKKTKGKGGIKHHPVIGGRRKKVVDTKAAWKVAQIEYRREKK